MAFAFQIRAGASEDRLEKLIDARLKPGADKDIIDARIWDLFGEEWAIMFTDLSGFSRHVEAFGVIHFLQIIYESQRLLVPCIDEHDGILLKMEGDSMMVIFRNATKAVEAAINMQQILQIYNQEAADTEKILLCVGLGFGKVLKIGDQDVFGAEVNAASKLGEDSARAGEILVTDSVVAAIQDAYPCEPIDYIPPGAKAAYRLLYSL